MYISDEMVDKVADVLAKHVPLMDARELDRMALECCEAVRDHEKAMGEAIKEMMFRQA